MFYFFVDFDDSIGMYVVRFAYKPSFDIRHVVDDTNFLTDSFAQFGIDLPDYINEEGENFFPVYDTGLDKDALIQDFTRLGFEYCTFTEVNECS